MIYYISFPHDVMHTFYHIQKELFHIIFGPYDDDFSVNKTQLSVLDSEISAWKWGISGQLGPKPKLLMKYKDSKSADHKTFSISYGLVLFDGYLPGEHMKGLDMFSVVYRQVSTSVHTVLEHPSVYDKDGIG